MQASQISEQSWLDRPISAYIKINWETALVVLLIVLAVATRFYKLEPRVMSHDENSHVYYSWLLYRGQGYSHDPVTHGPLQFHLVALSYFLFGDNDLTARIPAVLFSIATVAFLWNYRRYLGRAGALVSMLLMLISPFMLYYGRYVRNEAFVALFGVIMLWAILRYQETGRARYLIYLTIVTALHFATKETSFIYQAQAMIFLAFFALYQVTQKDWVDQRQRNPFLIALLIGLLLVGLAGTAYMLSDQPVPVATPEVLTPEAGQGLENPVAATTSNGLMLALIGGALIAFLGAVFLLIRGFTWKRLRTERSVEMLILLTAMVLPMLAPFPVKALGINPIDYQNNQSIVVTFIFVVIFALVASGMGLLWKPKLFLINAAVFYGIFTVFYTTVFTHGFGFVTGLVGSLGYWLEQQGVNRGSQPLYYYALIQIPIYEYLPALGSLGAILLAIIGHKKTAPELDEPEVESDIEQLDGDIPVWMEIDPVSGPENPVPATKSAPVFALLVFWSISSLLAYTIAGEKMPWLTVHITLPMILLSGWGFGRLIDGLDWNQLRDKRAWLVLLLLPVFLLSTMGALTSLLGMQPPFQGSSLEQLRATTTFLTALFTALISGIVLSMQLRSWHAGQFNRLVFLFVASFLALLTARAAFTASYINYDNATEYLVYAHSAGGVKEALNQIEEISRRTSGGLSAVVAYDDQTTYPYWWYLRNFTNQQFYGASPTRTLRDAPLILVGDSNYSKIEPVVGQGYYRFDYVRLWWPNQDYYDLTFERVLNVLRDPQMRSALYRIWMYRDYTLYGQLTNKDMTLENWYPSARMRLYVRKDVVGSVWNYGTVPTAEEIIVDPFEDKQIPLSADRIFGSVGPEPGQFFNPRDLAVAPDGSLYVADTGNHRVQHLAPDGSVLHLWGSLSPAGSAPEGTFNEPWGIAVGPDGAVYVVDTWNHRVQKFSPAGEFLRAWGYFGQAEAPEAFWGPRDVLVDAEGQVYVTDTGNKRVVVFDADGNFLTQFGVAGLGAGEFDEPVGLAMDAEGRLYVADTWNQRIQSFVQAEDGSFVPETSWNVSGWYGQSLENKPYLAASEQGVFASDPESFRVLQFDRDGTPLRTWGQAGSGVDSFGLVGSVAVDGEGGVWVTDTGNGRVMHFTLP